VKAIVLFGSPGSGKGTQAELLKNCLAVPHISTGDMLRNRIAHHQLENETRIAQTMGSGALVRDEVVNRLVEERLGQADAANGFILDGYPRTWSQAEHLSNWLERNHGVQEMVVHLAVDYNTIIARLTGRRQCPRCGSLYNLVSHPPKQEGVCDLDGERLIIRDDDRESVIRKRLDAYEQQTHPVLEYYRKAGRPIFEVDASHDLPEVISQKVCQAVDSNDCAKNSR
jgi:adenylate kinase